MWTAAFAILICRKHGDKKTILRIIGTCQCEVLLANSGMVTRYSRRRHAWWKRACKEPELSERIEMTRELKSHRAYGFSHAHAWVGSNWLKGCVSESNQSKILKRPSYKYPKPKRMYDKRNECARNKGVCQDRSVWLCCLCLPRSGQGVTCIYFIWVDIYTHTYLSFQFKLIANGDETINKSWKIPDIAISKCNIS